VKRIILGLLFDGVDFYLSRNFRLQRLGNMVWLQEHFGIFDLASHVDEVAVFHVARKMETTAFALELRELARNLFIPISVGGGVRSIEEADALFRSGADRIMFSNTLWNDPNLVHEVGTKYGKQSVIGVLNYSRAEGQDPVIRHRHREGPPTIALKELPTESLGSLAGELVLQSIDRDGTGQGFPLESLSHFKELRETPWIAAGGFGSTAHVSQALGDPRIEAVLTSNLLAFVGSGLESARQAALGSGVDLASWDRFSMGDSNDS
jgi:cyclase